MNATHKQESFQEIRSDIELSFQHKAGDFMNAAQIVLIEDNSADVLLVEMR